MRRRLTILAAAMLAAACTELGSDPSAVVALELEPSPVPAVVVGDTLRDTTGTVLLLQARAFNVENAPVAGAPVRFLALDTAVLAVDSITGAVVGRRVGQAAIVASVLGLQSERITIRVTLRPDTVAGLDSLRRSMQLSLTSPTAASSGALRVFVGHDTTIAARDTAVAVANWLVRYRIVFPADSTVSETDTSRVVLANDLGRVSTLDTTDASGVASRAVRISTAVSAIPDSVIVEATARRPDGTPLAGSPVRFVVRILRVN